MPTARTLGIRCLLYECEAGCLHVTASWRALVSCECAAAAVQTIYKTTSEQPSQPHGPGKLRFIEMHHKQTAGDWQYEDKHRKHHLQQPQPHCSAITLRNTMTAMNRFSRPSPASRKPITAPERNAADNGRALKKSSHQSGADASS